MISIARIWPCKLWFSGNHKPPLRNPDAAMRRRMNLVPLTYVPPKADTGLVDALKAELPGILAWAIKGCLDWQKKGLAPPSIVTKATDEYFAAQDSLAEWLGERCERQRAFDTSTRTLFTDWKTWATVRGEDAGTEKRFSDAMQRYAAKKKTNRGMVFEGLRLLPNDTGVM